MRYIVSGTLYPCHTYYLSTIESGCISFAIKYTTVWLSALLAWKELTVIVTFWLYCLGLNSFMTLSCQLVCTLDGFLINGLRSL